VRRFARVGIDDCYPGIVGDQAYLRQLYGLDRNATAAALRTMLEL
jgi:hypothetical protein